uniref:Uncharacterized protein n=1 Tax=Arundo donax TaxID=35708 RepID=A0A0A9HXG9_ARUDO
MCLCERRQEECVHSFSKYAGVNCRTRD